MSRATIQRAIRDGKLSLTPDKRIDPAEMLRVFGEVSRPTSRPTEPQKPTLEPGALAVENAELKAALAGARETIEALQTNLSDLRGEILRLTHDAPSRKARRWWPWGR